MSFKIMGDSWCINKDINLQHPNAILRDMPETKHDVQM